MKLVLDAFEQFVGVNLWTMLFAWCNLLILYLFLKKLLFVPVKNMIDARQKEVDDIYADAEDKQQSAEMLKLEYTERLSKAAEESDEILKRAQRNALLREEEIIGRANEEARRTLERAEETIALEKSRAINEAKDEVSSLSVQIASAILSREVEADEHEAVIDTFLEDLGN